MLTDSVNMEHMKNAIMLTWNTWKTPILFSVAFFLEKQHLVLILGNTLNERKHL